MAYAAVTSLMETLYLHFLQSQPRFPLEDLEAQIRLGNENVGLLQQILEAQIGEKEASSKRLRIKACFPRDYGKQQLAWDTTLLTSQLREVGEVKQKIVSLHQNLGLLQQSIEKSEITYDDARVRVMKDLEAQIRDASFKAEERIEMELSAIYLAKDSLHITACLLRLHQIFNEAQKQTRYQISDGNENLGLLQQIVNAQIFEMGLDEKASSLKRHGKAYKQQHRLKEKMVSFSQNLGLLQRIFEIRNDDAARVVMKDLEEEMRDYERYLSIKAEEWIEMELTTFYLAKDTLLHTTACLLRLHEIFIEAQKQTDYHSNELIRIQTDEYDKQTDYHRLAKVSLLGRIRRRGLKLNEGSSLHDLENKEIIVSDFSKNASKFHGGMVGCEKLVEKILDQLLTQQTTKGRQVVSMVGMGGIGKTTLAHKIYEHPSIISYFDMRAWVTVSQEFNKEQMLRCLIGCVTATSRDELHKQSTNQDQLDERLRKHLKEQRYLIVMDDIWSTTAWDSVQRCFPDDNNGSRILLTSRLRDVAEYASSSNSPLNMPFLDAYESWNLYCKVFGKTEFPLVFEKISRDIVKKCKGLPLAITIVASLLSKTKEEKEKWENVAKSVMGDSSDACSRILYLSYNQLPHHLKACFLYFGIFEEDYEISVKKLVRLWAAEGFFSTVKHVNLEKMAMECLQDLVDRSLVIVSKHSYNGEIKRIRIHDLLRDLCLREARLENLLNVNRVRKPCRWTSDISGRSFYYGIFRFEDEWVHKSHSFHLTRLYFFTIYNFSHLKLLRVVDMRNRPWGVDISLCVFANLVHLRYLALYTDRYCRVNLFEHWNNMQTFVVSGDDVSLYSSYEPSRIWKMPLLRNFCIGRIWSLETPSVVHRNLETISWLDSMLCTNDLFTMIPNLKTLGVDCEYYGTGPDSFYDFVHLEQLEKLSIRRWMDVNLVMCSIPWATSLPNLKKLSLLKSNILWSELSAISMLPNLEVLKLINACEGSKWETCYGGFHRLKRLVIRKTNLQYWNAVGDHFPMLECLEISDCSRLKEIPRDFADIITLALIQLSKCGDSVVASAKWIQEEQKSYGNEALLVRY